MKRLLHKCICAVLAAVLLSAPASQAKGWVNVSGWAYNDVSNFTNEGLLPESFDSVTDYRAPITVEQFCELIYSVALKFGREMEGSYQCFIDTDNKAVNSVLWDVDPLNNMLYEKEILELPVLTEHYTDDELESFKKKYDYYEELYAPVPLQVGCDDSGGEYYYVVKANPSNILTREQAAMCLAYYYRVYVNHPEETVPVGTSYKDASEAAYAGIYFSKRLGLMDASENAKESMTVEQAITAVYRLWRMIPTVPRADGSEIYDSAETLIRTYPNGVDEYKRGDRYLLKKDGEILKEFETDIYKNIYCADIADGRIIAAAQTYNEDTEVYDLSSGELIVKADILTYKADPDYIITKSSDMGPMTFGVCGYDGKTVLEPIYSLEEIDAMRRNGFRQIEMPYRKADGWVYYSDWNDNGHMYRIDTNGENKQLLSTEDCFNTIYIDGYLYYSVRGENENKLFCMKEDGTEKEQISEGYAYIYNSSHNDEGRDYHNSIGGWVYYIETDREIPYWSNGGEGILWRVRHTPEGTVKERVSDFEVCPENRNDECIYFFRRNEDYSVRSVYYLDKNGFRKLNDEYWTRVFFYGDTVRVFAFDREKKERKVLCGPAGNAELEPCTHNHYNDSYEEGGRIYYIQSNQSDGSYQVGRRDDGKRWVKNMKTGEITYLDTENCYIFSRMEDTLYIKDNKGRVYSYDLPVKKLTLLAENVYSIKASTDKYIVYTDYNRNGCCLNLKDGTVLQNYPNSGAYYRYGELFSLSYDYETHHLLKLDMDGRLVDITNCHTAYWVYAENEQ